MSDKETKPAHWLYTVESDNFDDARREIERLQRTIRLLIAGDFVSEVKVEEAHQIAGWK